MGTFLAGCPLAAATLAGLALAALALAARFGAGATPGERMCDRLLAACCLAVTLVQLAGFAGVLYRWPVALAALGGGAIAWLRGVRSELALARADFDAGLRALRRSPPLWAAGALGAYLALRGLQLPELSWDGLTYHLTYPALWLQHGAFVRFEAGGVWEQYETFPKGGEALFALAMLPFHADHFVHWVNLPLWAGTGVALRGAALRLGASPRAADSCAAIALGCPALSAYVTPAYVEVPSAFAFSTALAAGTRVFAGAQPIALLPLWLALGLGAAIKITALAYLPLGVLATLIAMREHSPAACLRPAARGVLGAGVVALPWYLHNVLQCDNPLYPAPLPGATHGPAAGTLANVWAVRETSVLSQAALGDILELLARPPWQVRYPLGPDWLYLAALPLSLFACLRARSRSVPILAAGAFGLGVLYLISPWNGVFREANTRFLMPSLMAALLAIGVRATRAPRWLAWAVGALGGVMVAIALARASFLRDVRWLSFALPVVIFPASVAARSASRRFSGAAMFMIFLTLAVNARQTEKLAAYSSHVDLHPVAVAPELWARIDALPPSRIAFSVGDVNATEGWFFYPLFGTRLQHAPRYVDIEADDAPACQRRGLIRDQPSESAWLARLRAQRIDYLVLAGAPLELSWVRAHPELFQQVFGTRGHAVYRLQPGEPAAGTR